MTMFTVAVEICHSSRIPGLLQILQEAASCVAGSYQTCWPATGTIMPGDKRRLASYSLLKINFRNQAMYCLPRCTLARMYPDVHMPKCRKEHPDPNPPLDSKHSSLLCKPHSNSHRKLQSYPPERDATHLCSLRCEEGLRLVNLPSFTVQVAGRG